MKTPTNTLFSMAPALTSNKQYYETPPEVYEPLHKEFGFTLDVCAEDSTAKCTKYYTIHTDGLRQSWAPFESMILVFSKDRQHSAKCGLFKSQPLPL